MTTLLLALVCLGMLANLGVLLMLLRRRPDAGIAEFRERLEESLRGE